MTVHEPAPISPPEEGRAWTDRYIAGSSVDAAPLMKLDLNSIRGFLWRQRLILIGVPGLALLAGFVLTLLTTPIYQATATVRVDPEGTDIFQGESLTPVVELSQLDSYLATLAKVIESRQMAAQVVDSLKLYKRDSFLGPPDEAPTGGSPAQIEAARRNEAISILTGGVLAEVPQTERLISISYKSDDPKLATEIANSYAENFLTEDLRRSLEKSRYAQNYLNSEIQQVRSRLDVAERRALQYARANGIVGQSLLTSNSDEPDTSGLPQTITAANLASASSSLSEARAKRIAAEQRWRAVAGTPVANLPEFQQNTAIQSLLAERGQISAQLAELKQRYGPDYPQIRELQAQLSTINRQIDQVGGEVKNGLRDAYRVALGEEQALSAELGRVSANTLDEQDRRVAFNQLNSEAQALQTQLQALLERYNQISASANVKPSTITMLDRAIVPSSPISPNLMRSLLVSLVLGGGLALGLGILRETLDDRLRSAEDVEGKLGVPLLGLTPLVDQGEDIEESTALAEAYSSIRAAIDFALPRPNHNVVLLTSSQSVEGKTTTAVAVAREYARLGRRVLLVDSDLRRPSISKAFGFKRVRKGFVEFLAGEATFEEVRLDQPLPNLDVIPVGSIPTHPIEILSSQRYDDFINRYRSEYDLIIIDSPPIMGLADAPLLARLADGVVFVVQSNRAHHGQAKTALRRLRDVDAKVLGVVLSKFRALDAGQSYGYQYSYYTYGDGKSD